MALVEPYTPVGVDPALLKQSYDGTSSRVEAIAVIGFDRQPVSILGEVVGLTADAATLGAKTDTTNEMRDALNRNEQLKRAKFELIAPAYDIFRTN